MRARTALLAALFSVAAGLVPAAAVAQGVVPAGVRVRLLLADGTHATGWLASFDSGTVRLAPHRDAAPGDGRPYPVSWVRSYQRADGRRHGHGALVGAGVGGVIGLGLIGAGLVGDAHSEDPMIPSVVFTLPLALLTTGLGAGLGALAAPTALSAPVPVTPTTASRIRPYIHDRSLGIALALRF